MPSHQQPSHAQPFSNTPGTKTLPTALSPHEQSIPEQSIPDIARQVLLQESEAVSRLAAHLPETFEQVVRLLLQTPGKVVLSGVGKSGHIARKIASTLSSTGTPACFLHPTEAGHGDLGLLTTDDRLILLSNSGETGELGALIQYAHRLKLPLIALTSQAHSTLDQASTLTLLLPQEAEACPFGFAPTTSSMLMLALGDALAICLLQLKNFKRTDYHLRHPGGALGLRLMKVSDIMRKGDQLPIVTEDQQLSDALLVMTAKGSGCLGIVDPSSSLLLGIITDGDLRRHMGPHLLTQRVSDIMTTTPFTIDEDALVVDALTCMNDRRITVLFANNQQKEVTGLVHMHDCLKAKIY